MNPIHINRAEHCMGNVMPMVLWKVSQSCRADTEGLWGYVGLRDSPLPGFSILSAQVPHLGSPWASGCRAEYKSVNE